MTYNIAALPEKPILTDQHIQNLLVIPKKITKKTPAREAYKEVNNQKRCELELETPSDDGTKLSVFIRLHSKFIENFSIGLRYQTSIRSLGAITLIRYNGAHGESSRHPDGHYALPHIHRISGQELAAGNTNPQESRREITDRYSTFEQALRIFFEDIGVSNYAEYFPEALQPRLFNEHP